MSDLQCAATLLIGPCLVDRSAALAESLASARVATVYHGGDPAARRTARSVASRVGAPERVFEGLGERADQESDAEVAARVVDALQSIADLHRGETVLVLASQTLVSLAVPGLADSAEDVDGPGDWRGFAEIRVDADAWTLRRWSWTPTAKPGRNT